MLKVIVVFFLIVLVWVRWIDEISRLVLVVSWFLLMRLLNSGIVIVVIIVRIIMVIINLIIVNFVFFFSMFYFVIFF